MREIETQDTVNKQKIGIQKSRIIKRKYLFLALSLSFIVNFDSNAAIPVIATYAENLGASIVMIGFIVGVYSMVHIPSNIVFGRLVDKIGRKTLISVGVMLDGLSLLLYSIALDPVFLLFGRIVHGIGGGFGGPATMAYISDATSQRRSGRGMALYGISIGFSNLIGFLLGGLVSQIIGVNIMFFTLAIILFIMTFSTFFLPKVYQHSKNKLNFMEELKIFRKTVLRKSMIGPYFSIFAMMFNMGIVTTVYTLMLEHATYTIGQIGMILSIMVIFSIIIHYPAGILSDKLGHVKVMLIGLIIVAAAFGVFMISFDVPIPMIGMILLGLGHGLIFPSSAGFVKTKTKSSESGIATGTFYALLVAGVAIGAPISGQIYSNSTEQITLLFGILTPLIVALILLIMLSFYRNGK
ncbi:MAG: MFS transporter [Candidatus Lokiarchaeota archaeon]|nr:MFS transporter [Candidatus Lokiarchaeota archaeon]